VPEVINFLVNACLHLAPHKFTTKNLPGWFPASDLNSVICQSIKLKASSKVTPKAPNLSALMGLEENGEAQDKVDALALALTLLARFAQMYASLSGFVELFSPVLEVLEGLLLNKQSTELQVGRLVIFYYIISQQYFVETTLIDPQRDLSHTQTLSRCPHTPPPPSTQTHTDRNLRTSVRSPIHRPTRTRPRPRACGRLEAPRRVQKGAKGRLEGVEEG
jgi:hypothetical protein